MSLPPYSSPFSFGAQAPPIPYSARRSSAVDNKIDSGGTEHAPAGLGENRQLETLRRGPWTSVLKEPMVFEGCEIVPLLTASALTRTGDALENCLDEHYADECARGEAHFFAMRARPEGHCSMKTMEFSGMTKTRAAGSETAQALSNTVA